MSKHVYTPKRRPIPVSVRRQVIERDGGKCVDCGRAEFIEFDHVIPWHVSQCNAVHNIQLRCRGCNALKGARLPGESAEEERRRIREHNQRIRSTPEFREKMKRVVGETIQRNKTDAWRKAFEQAMSLVDREGHSLSLKAYWRPRRVPREQLSAFQAELKLVQALERREATH